MFLISSGIPALLTKSFDRLGVVCMQIEKLLSKKLRKNPILLRLTNVFRIVFILFMSSYEFKTNLFKPFNFEKHVYSCIEDGSGVSTRPAKV